MTVKRSTEDRFSFFNRDRQPFEGELTNPGFYQTWPSGKTQVMTTWPEVQMGDSVHNVIFLCSI